MVQNLAEIERLNLKNLLNFNAKFHAKSLQKLPYISLILHEWKWAKWSQGLI